MIQKCASLNSPKWMPRPIWPSPMTSAACPWSWAASGYTPLRSFIFTSTRFALRHDFHFVKCTLRCDQWLRLKNHFVREKRHFVWNSSNFQNFEFSGQKNKKRTRIWIPHQFLPLGRWNWYLTHHVIRLTKWFSKSNYVHSPKGFRVFIILYECIKATTHNRL